MARQKIHHGATIDAITPEEAAALIRTMRESESRPVRVRAAATVKLDGTGNGQDEVYTVPMGFEFEARRITVDLDTASDPTTGNVSLGGTSDTDVDATATGAAAAIAAFLAGNPNTQLYLTGFEVTGSGATAGSVIVVTITGTLVTKSYELVIPAGVGTSITPLIVEFTRPIAANGLNQAISVNVPSFGAGNTNAAVTAHGFSRVASGRALELLRGGTRVEYLAPTAPTGGTGIPGVQTWGREQGPYFRNGEVVEVKARGLTGGAVLDVTAEGILRRPEARRGGA